MRKSDKKEGLREGRGLTRGKEGEEKNDSKIKEKK